MLDARGIKEFHKNGQVEWDIPLHGIPGKRHGLARNYYDTGAIKIERPYNMGVVEGVEYLYYPDGKIWQEIHYVGGKKNGPVKMFYRDGSPELEFVCKDDLRNGTFRRWDESGKLVYEENIVETASGV